MSRWAWSSVWNLTGRDWVILPSRVRSCWWLESRTPNGLEWPLDKNPLSSNGSMMLGVVVQCSICSCLWDSLDFLKMPFSLPCAHECIGWVVILLKLAKSFMTWLILCGTEDRLWARSQTFFEMKWIHRWGVPWQRWMKTEFVEFVKILARGYVSARNEGSQHSFPAFWGGGCICKHRICCIVLLFLCRCLV